MPNRHGFQVLPGDDPVRTQQRIFNAFESLDAATIRQEQSFVSFVVSGNNGVGIIVLPPVQDTTTGKILKRAQPGYIVAAAFNLTDDTDAQNSFERSISQFDQIRQLDTANLSAKKIGFILVSN